LLKKQGGLCPICGKKIDDPVLDHHQKKKIKGTGLVRGVLCRMCNVLLAKMENNASRYAVSQDELPDVLVRMAKYLQKKHYPYIHPSEAPKKAILTKSSYNKLAKAHHAAGIRARLPEYRYNAKGKPVQGLTKPLEKLFNELGITPEFYSK
jgi:hypothetical protein